MAFIHLWHGASSFDKPARKALLLSIVLPVDQNKWPVLEQAGLQGWEHIYLRSCFVIEAVWHTVYVFARKLLLKSLVGAIFLWHLRGNSGRTSVYPPDFSEVKFPILYTGISTFAVTTNEQWNHLMHLPSIQVLCKSWYIFTGKKLTGSLYVVTFRSSLFLAFWLFVWMYHCCLFLCNFFALILVLLSRSTSGALCNNTEYNRQSIYLKSHIIVNFISSCRRRLFHERKN